MEMMGRRRRRRRSIYGECLEIGGRNFWLVAVFCLFLLKLQTMAL